MTFPRSIILNIEYSLRRSKIFYENFAKKMIQYYKIEAANVSRSFKIIIINNFSIQRFCFNIFLEKSSGFLYV